MKDELYGLFIILGLLLFGMGFIVFLESVLDNFNVIKFILSMIMIVGGMCLATLSEKDKPSKEARR